MFDGWSERVYEPVLCDVMEESWLRDLHHARLQEWGQLGGYAAPSIVYGRMFTGQLLGSLHWLDFNVYDGYYSARDAECRVFVGLMLQQSEILE